jgi:hypothetical protein
MKAQCDLLPAMYLAPEEWRTSREDVYADMFKQCGRGIQGLANAPCLTALLTPVWTTAHYRVQAEFQDILLSSFRPANGASEELAATLSRLIMEFLLREQAVLRTALTEQNHINLVVGRGPPRRTIRGAELNVYNLMHGPGLRRLPYLTDELERLLGVGIAVDAESLAISRVEPAMRL